MNADTQTWGAEAKHFDFGILSSRNQLVLKVINPVVDALLNEARVDHVKDSGDRYQLKIYLVRERDVEDGQAE
ncbi:hypothetical protein UFOVP154_21 [uncultured Caudovirales phage]|uniref:Uncharacterized protein n=1 Tax=uncultured Caudovirales phage TaxID=2100421 RepID=A0A6J5KL62_9CAUD|nr:hypothetical protein UFOVP8_6 [uncultured Caudovirales phage]CAB5170379.1 hypothetical protein UFOVP154_21 [uncultured Caudovirales phage]